MTKREFEFIRGEEYNLFGIGEDIGHYPPNVAPRYVRREKFKDSKRQEMEESQKQ